MIRALDPDLEKDFQLFEDSSIKFGPSKNLGPNSIEKNPTEKPTENPTEIQF